MDVPTFFKEHERMCRYYKNGIDCGGCPIVKKDLIQYEKCFDYCAHYPEKAVSIVEEWAKEHPVRAYKGGRKCPYRLIWKCQRAVKRVRFHRMVVMEYFAPR